MRYRRNGKQVLCNDEHFADGVSEEAAALICAGLNAMGDNAYITALPRDDEPSLFFDPPPNNSPGWRAEVEADTAAKDADRAARDAMKPPCGIRQYSDQYACVTHKTQWDVNDPDPPMPCGGNVP